jgi:hypothetical protein
MKKLGVKMRPEMLLHTKQTRPELHAASPLNAELLLPQVILELVAIVETSYNGSFAPLRHPQPTHIP